NRWRRSALEYVSCPYCNSQFPAPASAMTRLTCPRCGEMVPFQIGDGEIEDRGSRIEDGGSKNHSQSSILHPRSSLPSVSPPSWRAPLWTLGAGLLIILGWMFSTQGHEDLSPSGQAEAAATAPLPLRPAANLPALGYLPPDTEVIVALQGFGTPHSAAGMDY